MPKCSQKNLIAVKFSTQMLITLWKAREEHRLTPQKFNTMIRIALFLCNEERFEPAEEKYFATGDEGHASVARNAQTFLKNTAGTENSENAAQYHLGGRSR